MSSKAAATRPVRVPTIPTLTAEQEKTYANNEQRAIRRLYKKKCEREAEAADPIGYAEHQVVKAKLSVERAHAKIGKLQPGDDVKIQKALASLHRAHEKLEEATQHAAFLTQAAANRAALLQVAQDAAAAQASAQAVAAQAFAQATAAAQSAADAQAAKAARRADRARQREERAAEKKKAKEQREWWSSYHALKETEARLRTPEVIERERQRERVIWKKQFDLVRKEQDVIRAKRERREKEADNLARIESGKSIKGWTIHKWNDPTIPDIKARVAFLDQLTLIIALYQHLPQLGLVQADDLTLDQINREIADRHSIRDSKIVQEARKYPPPMFFGQQGPPLIDEDICNRVALRYIERDIDLGYLDIGTAIDRHASIVRTINDALPFTDVDVNAALDNILRRHHNQVPEENQEYQEVNQPPPFPLHVTSFGQTNSFNV